VSDATWIEAAKRLAAHPRMRALWDAPGFDFEIVWDAERDITEMVPNLSDWATIGVLLGLLVEERGGMFWRAMDMLEEHLCEPGAPAPRLMPGAAGVGEAVALALLEMWEQDTPTVPDGVNPDDWVPCGYCGGTGGELGRDGQMYECDHCAGRGGGVNLPD